MEWLRQENCLIHPPGQSELHYVLYRRLKKTVNYSKGSLLRVVVCISFIFWSLFFSGLVGGIDSLTKYFEGDDLVSSTLQKFSWALSELRTYLTVSENWMLHCSSNSPLQELWREWVQAFSAMISGIVWVDKCYLWWVDGIQGNH